MITCRECGKTDGRSEIGTSWICEDCKVEYQDQGQDEGKSEEETENRPE